MCGLTKSEELETWRIDAASRSEKQSQRKSATNCILPNDQQEATLVMVKNVSAL